MKVLVCVKRVPMTGGRIVLTEDALAIETKHLGFAVSPHEECGVEEAVRLVEQHGGESVVLTLGPADAEEQLRDAMAIGIDRGHPPRHRRRGVGSRGDRGRDRRCDPRRRGRLGAVRPRSSSATSRPTRAASRSASGPPMRSGAPARPGSRASSSRAGSCAASRRSAAAVTSTSCRCLLCVTVLEGLNLPRYPSVPGRMRAGRKPLEASTPARPRVAARAVAARRAGGRGEAGRGARPRAGGGRRPSSTCSSRSGWHREPRSRRARRRRRRPTSRCRRSRSRPTLGGETHALLIGPGGAAAAQGVPVAVAHVAEHAGARRVRARRVGGDRLRGWPTGSARPPSWRPGTGPATDAMARAAVRLGEPLAANVTAVTPGAPLTLTRLRWGGSLLEEAELHAGRALLTVAPHTVAAVAAGRARLGRDVHARAGRGRPRRARARPRRAAGGRRVARRREGRRHRWSRRRLGGGIRRDRGARRRCSAARSAARAR